MRRPEFRQDENFLSILWRKGADATEGTASQETGNVKRVVLAVGALCFAEESRLKEIPAFADDEMRTALDSSAFNVRTRHWIPAWRSERLAQKTPP